MFLSCWVLNALMKYVLTLTTTAVVKPISVYALAEANGTISPNVPKDSDSTIC